MAHNINHFANANAMLEAIAVARALPTPAAQRDALEQTGEYRSRGHGGKHMPKGRFLGWGYRQSRSKYQPHQGAQECTRRLRQDEVLGEKALKKLSAAYAEFESC